MPRKLHVLRHAKLTPELAVKPGDVVTVGDGDGEVPAHVAHSAVAFGNARELSESEAKAAPEGDSIDDRDPRSTNRDPQRRK